MIKIDRKQIQAGYYESQTEIKLKKSLKKNNEEEEQIEAAEDASEEEELADAEDLAKKHEQDLSQDVYTNLMKEMAHDSNSQTISYENLGLLLFMTQKAISDLKLLKSLFQPRKQQYNAFGTSSWGGRRSNQSYWDNLNQDVKFAIKTLPVNPLKLDKNLRNMISNCDEEPGLLVQGAAEAAASRLQYQMMAKRDDFDRRYKYYEKYSRPRKRSRSGDRRSSYKYGPSSKKYY